MARRGARILLAMALVAIAACTTTEVQQPGARPDFKEAATLNTQLGIDYMRAGNMDLALEKLKRAVVQDPDLAVAHSTLALVYQRKGEAELAEDEYREALNINKSDPGTLNNFGVFLCGQGKIDDAEEAFVKAAKMPANTVPADAWANAGVCVRRSPKKDIAARAEDYFRQALQFNPRHSNALAQMAQLNFAKKDNLRARAFISRYEAVVPKPAPDMLALGARNERVLGDLVAARSYERRLRTEYPDAQETYDLFKSGKP
jgi:type IV pilus assembly protein PilF